MKIYYFSSFLLLTLFYMVNGQNVSGTKAIQKTIPKISITYYPPPTSTTTIEKPCPTLNVSNIERLCEKRGGGKLIQDECGFNTICLIPCGADSTTSTDVATTAEVLPSRPSVYDNYEYCSCIYTDRLSTVYGPAKYSPSVSICELMINDLLPNDSNSVTTTTTTSTPIKTTEITNSDCPNRSLMDVSFFCEQNKGTLITDECGEFPVCLLSCDDSALKKRMDALPTTDTIIATKTPKYIPDDARNGFSSYLENFGKQYNTGTTKTLPTTKYITTTTTTKYIPDDARNGFSSYLENFGKQYNTGTTKTLPTTKYITTTTTTKYIPDDARNGFSSYLENFGKQYNTGTTKTLPITKFITTTTTTTSTSTTKTPKYIPDDLRYGFSSYLENYKKQQQSTTSTTTVTKTLPTTKEIPTSVVPVIKDYDLKHGNFNGIIYCSCIYDDKSTPGIQRSDNIGECQKRLPSGDTSYTIISGGMVTTVSPKPSVTTVPAITSSISECIETVTVTEKEIETVTVRETITVKQSIPVTADEKPTPVQCAEKRAQCGGKNYSGPTCCPEGYICRPFTSYYSECVEKGKEY